MFFMRLTGGPPVTLIVPLDRYMINASTSISFFCIQRHRTCISHLQTTFIRVFPKLASCVFLINGLFYVVLIMQSLFCIYLFSRCRKV